MLGLYRARPFATLALLCAISLAVPWLVAGPMTDASPASRPSVAGAGNYGDALLVRYAPGSRAAVDRLLPAAGATAIGRLDELSTVVVAPQVGRSRSAVRDALLEDRNVVSVEQDGTAKVALDPDDTLWYQQWGARKVKEPQAWDMTTGSNGPVVAVLDTGVAAGHIDLAGHLAAGWDFVHNDSKPGDDNGHGTMVTGVVVAQGNNSVGVAGTCWGCRVMPVKVANRYGDVKWSNAAAGLIWATKNGARVINMSFGAYTTSSTFHDAVDYALTHGVVVIAAAGNNGNTKKFYPAAFSGVISVAATTSSDKLYSWSTRGSWVKLAAPGCVYTTKRSGGWGSFCGTSASAPMVAGLAGLMFAAKPTSSKSEVQRAILDTAYACCWRIGGGRIDALQAVAVVSPIPPPTPSPSPSPTPSAAPSGSPDPTPSPDPSAQPSPSP